MKLQEFLEIVGKTESDLYNRTHKECMNSVKASGYALRYVKEQTPEICIAAVKKDGYALPYVDRNIFEIG